MQVLGISLAGYSLVACTIKGNIEDISNAEVSFSEPSGNKYINTTNYDFKVQVNSSNIGITSDKAVVEVYESKDCDTSKLVSTTAFAASGTVGTSSVASLQDGKIYSARIIVKDKDKTFQSVCSGWVGVDLQKPNPVSVSYPSGNTYVSTKELLTAWSPSTDNGISGLSDVPYRLRLYGLAACAGPVLQTADSADIQYKFKKLTQGVTYSVQVSAVDKATNESLISCSPYTEVDVNAPGFRFEDATSSSGYSRITNPAVYFDNDASASYWCLTQDLTFVPTSYTDVCPGGGGTTNGWFTSRPSMISITPGDGLKSYDLWIVRGDGSLISNRKTSAAITLDQTLPGAFTVSGVGGISDSVFDSWLTSSGNPTIRWAPSTDAVDYTLEIRTPGNSLVCSQAGIPAAPQEVTLTNCATLVDGQTYKVRMISYDVARNFVIAPDFNFTVDRSFPGAFSISGISGGQDTTIDHFLGPGNPIVNYSAASGATHYKIEVKDSGGSATICTLGGQVAPGGVFDYNTEAGVSCTGLTHGATYKVYVTAYNAGETATAASNNGYTFQVDTVAPTLSIDSHPPVLTSDTFADFTFTAADALSGLGGTQCQLDAAAYAPCTSPVHLVGVTEGVHVYNVKAIDNVGTVTTQSFSWRVDLSNPVLTILTQPPAYLNSLAVGISFSATDAAGIAGYQCSMDGAPLSNCNSPLNFVTSEGPHSVLVRATDNTGFYDEKTVNFFADLTNPILTITSQPPAFTSNSAIYIGFSATDAAGIAGYQCGIDGAALSTCSSPLTFTATEGPHSVIVRATDNTGLYDEKTVNFRLDTTNPVLTINSQPPAYTANPNETITFSATDAAGIALYECGIDGAALTVCSSPLNFTVAEGPHTVIIRATDNTGFYDEKTVSFVMDITNPVVTITSQPTNPSDNVNFGTFSFSVADTNPTSTTCSIDGGAYSACTSPSTPSGLGSGSHTYAIRATDGAGNIGNASYTWTIYNYTWLSSGWVGCTATQPAWSTGGWGACSVGQPAYSYGGWGGCSTSCGPGTMYRTESCNYVYGTQSRTVSCPTNSGTETRTVQCQRNDGVIVADGFCLTAKPAGSEACSRNDCPGGAPANSQGCSRGGGSDCNSAQATSAGCNPGSCTGTWVLIGSSPAGADCSNYTSYNGCCGTFAGAYSGWTCYVRPTVCNSSDGKGGYTEWQCQ